MSHTEQGEKHENIKIKNYQNVEIEDFWAGWDRVCYLILSSPSEDGSQRFRADYQVSTLVTAWNSAAIPRMDYFIDLLEDAWALPLLYSSHGYGHVEMEDAVHYWNAFT